MKKRMLVFLVMLVGIIISGCQPEKEPWGKFICGDRVIELNPFPTTWIPKISGPIDDFVEGRCIAQTNVSIYIETLRFEGDRGVFESKYYKDGDRIEMHKETNSFEFKISSD